MPALSSVTRIQSREGRLLITAERVSLFGASSWDVPRALVSGVSASAGLVSADLLICTNAGQRHPVRGVLFRDALVAIELLGYLPPPSPAISSPATGPVPFLSIPTNYTPGCLIITDQLVRLEGRTAWEIARAEVRGASIEPGTLTARLLLHTRDGRVLCADYLPFNGALRALERLGYIPRESAPLRPVPDISFPPLPPLTPQPTAAPAHHISSQPLPPLSLLDGTPRPASHAAPRTIPLAKPRETGQRSAIHSSAPAPTARPTSASPSLPRQPALPPAAGATVVNEVRQWMTARLQVTTRWLARTRSSLHPLVMLAPVLILLHWMPQAQQRFLTHLRGFLGRTAVTSRAISHWIIAGLRSVRSLPARRIRHTIQHTIAGTTAAMSTGIRRAVTHQSLVAWPARIGTQLSRSAAALAHDSRRMVSVACLLFFAVLLSVGVIADHQLIPARGTSSRHVAQPAAAPHPASPTVAPPPATPTPIPPPVPTVFAGSHDGSLYALRASDGALLWRYKTGGQIESAPALADGIVYAGSDDHTIYALRSQDDTIVWRYRTGGKVEGSPTVANGVVYIGSNDGYLYALRAGDGALLWRYPTASWIVGQPAVVNGIVYIGSYDDYLYAVRASDGALLWRYKTHGAIVSSPAVSAGVVYVGSADHSLYVLRASDGALLWYRATGGSLLSSPVVRDGVIYIGSLDGALYAFRARDGALLWRYTTGGPVLSSPVIAGTSVYIGSNDGYLYALRASDGALLWRYRTGGAVNTVPDIAQGMVYVGSADHNVYALRASDGARVWSFQTGDVVSPRLAVGL